MPGSMIDCFIAGDLTRDFIIKSEDDYYLDIPGGHALYVAGGMMLWKENAGLLSTVGEDYPQDWITDFEKKGLEISGIQIQPGTRDHRRFYGYLDDNALQTENPISYFEKKHLPFPKALIGYQPQKKTVDSRTATIPSFCRINDIPSAYLDCPSAHLCPMDFQSHMVLPDSLRQGHITTISIHASASYMDPLFLEKIPYLVNHISVFHISETNIRELFRNRTKELWEMAEAIGNGGCELLVIHKTDHSFILYNGENREKWIIPPYPIQINNNIGVEDYFCGGFFAKYRKSFDPVESALYGAVSASFMAQGFGPFYALDAFSGLPEARLDKLREMVHKL
jgi:sugar/nucleoside kinase (ribokinase family)